jgi:hypothetical protein
MADDLANRVTEGLAGASIPALVKGLGLAVAEANKALGEAKGGVLYTIPEAEIELAVAFSLEKGGSLAGSVEGGIYAFNVNASYSNTFNYRAEGSSRIRILLRATLPENPPENKPA